MLLKEPSRPHKWRRVGIRTDAAPGPLWLLLWLLLLLRHELSLLVVGIDLHLVVGIVSDDIGCAGPSVASAEARCPRESNRLCV